MISELFILRPPLSRLLWSKARSIVPRITMR